MAIVNVLMDTAAERGSKFDDETRAEIEFLSPDLEAGQVGEVELAAQAVSRAKIKLGAVDSPQIAENGVQAVNVAPLAVGTAALQPDSVTGEKAGPGVVSAVDASGAYIESKEWHGTAAEFQQIAQPDPNTNYYVR
ncbi:hypothetical protein KAYACHO_35 [Mycobacterium phage KayaCho]|uniref:tail fiber protein n=1 Tax=Mycobacterium phage KayaCho TaxID=1340830 RepID=UPI0003881C26|nr:tail fiber protein [Mycobacterium phage KayaCho]AGT12939.1 hypothetical protein KAYACHO_35 [Mycobacterium phage KayaCho]